MPGRWTSRGRDNGALSKLKSRLGARERLLADARATDGEAVGGSNRALYLPGGVALEWHEIDRAAWLTDESVLEVVTLPIDTPAQSFRVPLTEPGRVPELVRERVTSTIVVNQHVALVRRRGARIVARRRPGTPELDWVVLYDGGIDAEDPEIQARIQGEVLRLRAGLGV